MEEFIFGSQLQKDSESTMIVAGQHGNRQAWWREQQQARNREGELEMMKAFELSKPSPVICFLQ